MSKLTQRFLSFVFKLNRQYFFTLPKNRASFSGIGFTLVELLVVIGVLGVLAAAVLVAVNPVEQFARGRDSARIAAIKEIGNAWSKWSTALATTYPPAAQNWQTTRLISGGELKNQIKAPTPQIGCGVAANRDSNVAPQNYICYAPISVSGVNRDYVVWIRGLQSKSMLTKVGGSCPNGTDRLTAAYFGSRGVVQLLCLTNASSIPALTDTTYDL